MTSSRASQTLTTGPTTTRLASVVVGIDDSPCGRSALLWAARHAWLIGARLEVSALPTRSPDAVGIDQVLRAFPSLPVSVRRRADGAGDLISASRTADMIVLGCHDERQQGIGLSPTVEAVTPLADCDVVVVGGKPDAILGGHRRVTVLLARETMERAVLGAIRMARPGQTPVHLVLPVPPIYVSRIASATVERRPVLDEAAAMVRRLSPMIRVSTELLSAKPHEAVVRFADTDVLVVGADGPLDALARAALHHARCPVLVAHRSRVVDPVSE